MVGGDISTFVIEMQHRHKESGLLVDQSEAQLVRADLSR